MEKYKEPKSAADVVTVLATLRVWLSSTDQELANELKTYGCEISGVFAKLKLWFDHNHLSLEKSLELCLKSLIEKVSSELKILPTMPAAQVMNVS